jgi:hypothetical protein
MGFFFKNAKDRAKDAWASASRAQRQLDAAAMDLRQMERILARIYTELPPGAPGNLMKNMERSMNYTERHAKQTHEHLQALKRHVSRFEEHLRQARHHSKQ